MVGLDAKIDVYTIYELYAHHSICPKGILCCLNFKKTSKLYIF